MLLVGRAPQPKELFKNLLPIVNSPKTMVNDLE
jgi:hypothetical protein